MLERKWGSGDTFECIEEENAPGAAVSCGVVLSDERANHSSAHMAHTELPKFEERIVQRVLVETVKNVRATPSFVVCMIFDAGMRWTMR